MGLFKKQLGLGHIIQVQAQRQELEQLQQELIPERVFTLELTQLLIPIIELEQFLKQVQLLVVKSESRQVLRQQLWA